MAENTVRIPVVGALAARFFCADCADPARSGAHVLDVARTYACEGTRQDGGGR